MRRPVKLRKPQWLKAPLAATLNDQAVELSEDKLHWFTLQRVWNSGNRLDIELPMSPTINRLHKSPLYAITVGPVVLAGRKKIQAR